MKECGVTYEFQWKQHSRASLGEKHTMCQLTTAVVIPYQIGTVSEISFAVRRNQV